MIGTNPAELSPSQGQLRNLFERKIVRIFLSISLKNPQHMFWLRKKKSFTHSYLGVWGKFLNEGLSVWS